MIISLESTKKWIKPGLYAPPAARLVCYSKRGQGTSVSAININSAAKKRLLTNTRHIELFYDPQNRYIGLKPVARKHSNSYSISNVGNNRAYQISATAFVRQHGIDNMSSDWGDFTHYNDTLIFPIVDPTFYKGTKQLEDWIGVDRSGG
jgi:hypothetical protein